MNKMPKMDELTVLVEAVKQSINLQEVLSMVTFDAKEKEMLDRRILLSKQLAIQLALNERSDIYDLQAD